ncbi:unnamed protein product [Vicia faba]|uniref:Exocyst complex subunit Exo70 C-terminal domain-containing protein n=1 Tax=Vicia faba TaxID=3906 RepID=A0AAV0YN35_VICFA|nr:unnamed protein product [Vicia faba]
MTPLLIQIPRWMMHTKTQEVFGSKLIQHFYDIVFSESTSIVPYDIYFTKVCHGATIELLNFADLFANRITSAWRIFNKQLKKQIIVYVENMLLPAYENFITEFENVVGKNADDYIMYGVSDIQDELNNLFLLQDVESVRGAVSNQLVS